jgi:uncharacterized protein (DUF1800 family)
MQIFTQSISARIRRRPGAWVALLALTAALAACGANLPPAPAGKTEHAQASLQGVALLNRITWGVTPGSLAQAAKDGDAWLDLQLRPAQPTVLPATVQAQIDAMTIVQKPTLQIVTALEQQRKDLDAIKDDSQKKAAQTAYQAELTRIVREAQTRHLLRALYSPAQLQEQMTWFWMNHFNVHMFKANLRTMVGDYEEVAIRPHALGRFRDLLGATLRHPAMIRYLDNEQNAVGKINENYARELMELHTLGVGSGYTQADVQELARILTGVGTNFGTTTPKLKPGQDKLYVRDGGFEFNPNRHDFGDKQFLGQTVKGRGLAEVDEALDRLARHPATARFVSRKLALYFVSDDPPPALVERMANTFLQSDGDIASTLKTLFRSPEFAASARGKFKDPIHFVVSAVRLAYGDQPILNAAPVIGWLDRMAQPLYGRQTPDGYPLTQDAWASPGQMTTRFEIAKAIGSGNAGLFKPDPAAAPVGVVVPQMAALMRNADMQTLIGPRTQLALDQTKTPQEWNTFLLASPDFMQR